MNKKLLPAKLKELRTVHGYTQDYVASVLGIARQTYSHYETGKRKPSPDSLFKLAGLYNISVDDLMQFTLDIDRNISYDAPAPSQSSRDLEGFINFFNQINNQKKFHNHIQLTGICPDFTKQRSINLYLWLSSPTYPQSHS